MHTYNLILKTPKNISTKKKRELEKEPLRPIRNYRSFKIKF